MRGASSEKKQKLLIHSLLYTREQGLQERNYDSLPKFGLISLWIRFGAGDCCGYDRNISVFMLY